LGRPQQLIVRGVVELRDHDSGNNRHKGNDNQQLDEREGSVTSWAISRANRPAAVDSALGAVS
jgi:hypothetical protein